jgi:RNA polymerase sigma factor (sigma-70 family)
VDFETLFDEVYPALFRYCQRLTGEPDVADDVAQEAFVRLVDRRITGDPRALRVWLFKVATHVIRDRVRTRENRRRLLAANPVAPGSGDTPDREAERNETIQAVRAALDQLELRDRQMLLMRYEGFSYKELAEVVGVAHTSMGTLLARAQRRFARTYQESQGAHDSSR